MSEKAQVPAVVAGQQAGTDSMARSAASPPAEPCEIIDGIEINEQFRAALQWLNDSEDCIFITGKAGTGKSTLLKHFVNTTGKQVALLAPTGVAALNIGGMTIHSFFRFPARPIADSDIRVSFNKKLYQSFDAIIIDEISMVRTDMLDAIDKFLRLNGKSKKKPFGGIQMIFFGDLYQLPPIISGSEERQYLTERYPGAFFYHAQVLKKVALKIIELDKVYRQTDTIFIEILNAIRKNNMTDDLLQRLNSRYQPEFHQNAHDNYITLTPTRDLALRINNEKLRAIPSPYYNYRGQKIGDFPDQRLPTDLVLLLKPEAQVMFVKNDPKGRWVNGTLGKVTKLGKNFIKVALLNDASNDAFEVDLEEWEIYRYQYDAKNKRIQTQVTGSFRQYPLKLAWAVTIHKSQGLTFDRMILDLGRGAFAAGQTYVALSRCKSLEGIVLRKKITLEDIKLDPEVLNFMSQSQQQP